MSGGNPFNPYAGMRELYQAFKKATENPVQKGTDAVVNHALENQGIDVGNGITMDPTAGAGMAMIGSVKGSIAARNAAKTPELAKALQDWLHGGKPASRDAAAQAVLPPEARAEMMRRVAAQGEVRQNPVTGEHEFKLYRRSQPEKDGEITSWSPIKPNVNLYQEPEKIQETWAKKDQMINYPNMLGSPYSSVGYEGPNETTQHYWMNGGSPFRGEHEVIAKIPPDQRVDVTHNNPAVPTIHEAINDRVGLPEKSGWANSGYTKKDAIAQSVRDRAKPPLDFKPMTPPLTDQPEPSVWDRIRDYTGEYAKAAEDPSIFDKYVEEFSKQDFKKK